MTETTATVWYFAIGSMTNPVSLKQRNLSPLQSFPALLRGYRLGFFTRLGFAGAVADESSSFHGVLHQMTLSEMEQLDKIEAGYDKVSVLAHKYDGTTQECYVYILKAEFLSDINLPPPERYLDVIIAGCRHYNVDQSHITYLESCERKPRKQPHEFARIPDVEDKPIWTMEQVALGDGKRGGDNGPYYTVVNGKVREFIGPKDYIVFKMFTQLNVWGDHYDVWNAKMMYDPKYGECASIDDMLREHCACIEDFHVNYDKENGYFKTVAVVERRYRD